MGECESMTEREKMIERARKFWQARDVEPTPITMADFALSQEVRDLTTQSAYEAGVLAERARWEAAVLAAKKPTYGTIDGRFLNNWELGFEEGRKAAIAKIREGLKDGLLD
jgi:hypothetical protein